MSKYPGYRPVETHTTKRVNIKINPLNPSTPGIGPGHWLSAAGHFVKMNVNIKRVRPDQRFYCRHGAGDPGLQPLFFLATEIVLPVPDNIRLRTACQHQVKDGIAHKD